MNHYLKYIERSTIYYLVLISEILLFTWLNYDNTIMSGIIPNYQNFTFFFNSGFDLTTPFPKGMETFPMWGYGLVFLLTKNKLIILIVQQVFSVFTIYFTETLLKRYGLKNKTLVYFRVLIILGFSWHIFHTVIWPYSIAANCMIISLLLLFRFYQTNKTKHLICSAILFGVTLNFRSDYYYFMLCYVLIQLVLYFIKKQKKYAYILAWGAIVLVTLIPWGIYSHYKTGHFLTTSTNSGHVLFISLGQLPNNSWGITPLDGDQLMHEILKEKLGDQYNGSLNYEADIILTEAWKERVFENPLEFIKKCSYNILLYFLEPYTHGQLYQNFTSKKEWDNTKYIIKQDVLNFRLVRVFQHLFNYNNTYIWIILIVSITSFLINILFWLFLIKRLISSWKELISNDLFILLICTIGYQISLQTFAYYISYYNNNIYIFYIILLSLLLNKEELGSANKEVNSLKDC